MFNIYIDEKGTQSTYKLNKNNCGIRIGDDKMESFICSAVMIPKDSLYEIEREFLGIENSFIENSINNNQKNKYNDEIKSAYLYKRGVFKFGFNSSLNKELKFANDIMDLCNKYDLHVFNSSTHKIGTIISDRFLDWILSINEKYNDNNAYLMYYSLTKYLQNNASEVVFKSLFDENINSYNLLLIIKKDLEKIVEENLNNKRMLKQIINYRQLIFYIENTEDTDFISNYNITYKMNWNKLIFSFDLWLLELTELNKSIINSSEIYLDNGLPINYFRELGVKNVFGGLESSDYFGLRIADFFAVVVGNYISLLSENSKHDLDDLTKTIRLDKKWFESDSNQFYTIKKFKNTLLKGNTYDINIDTFFDDALLFVSYIEYYDRFKSHVDFNSISSVQHSEDFFLYLKERIQNKYVQVVRLESLIKSECGSIKNGIQQNIIRPM